MLPGPSTASQFPVGLGLQAWLCHQCTLSSESCASASQNLFHLFQLQLLITFGGFLAPTLVYLLWKGCHMRFQGEACDQV